MLQSSDINFFTLVHEIDDGVYVSNLKGTIIYANLAFAYIFGFEKPEDIKGRNIKDFLSPGKKIAFFNQFKKSMFTKKHSVLISTEVIRQNGKIATIEMKCMPFIKNGKLLGNQGVVHDITERKQAEKKKKYLSTHDSLTGLYNRAFFESEMKRFERGRQYPISIVVVQFEIVKNSDTKNNQEVGDKLRKHLAHVLFHIFRGDDIIAYFGEEKFTVLLPSVDENMVKVIIKRLRENLQKNKGNENVPTLEFHIGAGTAKKGEKLNSVLEQAEAIVYLSKKKNKII